MQGLCQTADARANARSSLYASALERRAVAGDLSLFRSTIAFVEDFRDKTPANVEQ
jgi:hypothetical protein